MLTFPVVAVQLVLLLLVVLQPLVVVAVATMVAIALAWKVLLLHALASSSSTFSASHYAVHRMVLSAFLLDMHADQCMPTLIHSPPAIRVHLHQQGTLLPPVQLLPPQLLVYQWCVAL